MKYLIQTYRYNFYKLLILDNFFLSNPIKLQIIPTIYLNTQKIVISIKAKQQ